MRKDQVIQMLKEKSQLSVQKRFLQFLRTDFYLEEISLLSQWSLNRTFQMSHLFRVIRNHLCQSLDGKLEEEAQFAITHLQGHDLILSLKMMTAVRLLLTGRRRCRD